MDLELQRIAFTTFKKDYFELDKYEVMEVMRIRIQELANS